MKPWILFAVVSTFFAGATSVLAKAGLRGISGELGLVVRTAFVLVLVMALALPSVARQEWTLLDRRNLAWLAASATATALSWLFYYKALRDGEVSTIALIDKGSVIVALVLAWLALGEPFTIRTLAGAALVLAGVLVIARG